MNKLNEDKLTQLLEAYLTASLAEAMVWTIYCIWHEYHYGIGAGAADHRNRITRTHPLYILYKETEYNRSFISRVITKELGGRGWIKTLKPIASDGLLRDTYMWSNDKESLLEMRRESRRL